MAEDTEDDDGMETSQDLLGSRRRVLPGFRRPPRPAPVEDAEPDGEPDADMPRDDGR